MGFEASKDRARAALDLRPGCLDSPGRPSADLPQENVAGDDPRVVEALEEYLAACERGTRPDRWRFLARHGVIADRLAECLDSIDCLFQSAPMFEVWCPDDTAPFHAGGMCTPPSMLGD